MIGILTEKPSAGRNFATALGGQVGTYNGQSYKIVSARGHLYEYDVPENQVSSNLYDKYKSWDLVNLPWNENDISWRRVKKQGTSQLLATLKKELSTCDEIVIATDVDPTGEVLFWLVGFSNAVNLSDGLDGLATGLSIIAYATYAWIAYQERNWVIVVFTLSVIGGLVGFFIFNHKPAKIFMGDAGSLALGGGLATVSIFLHRPWSLLLIGIVFVLETLSVILQVISFQTTGKRIFKMTPIHHHFEMLGWSEWKVDIVFWIVGLIGSIIYLIIWG